MGTRGWSGGAVVVGSLGKTRVGGFLDREVIPRKGRQEEWRRRNEEGFGGWDKPLGSRVRLIFISDKFR